MRENGIICPFGFFSGLDYSNSRVKDGNFRLKHKRKDGEFGAPRPKAADMPAKQAKTQQDQKSPQNRVWP